MKGEIKVLRGYLKNIKICNQHGIICVLIAYFFQLFWIAFSFLGQVIMNFFVLFTFLILVNLKKVLASPLPPGMMTNVGCGR